MWDLGVLLHPPTGLTVPAILGIAVILGLLHGATPDEHTWPITFSYSVGSYSHRGGLGAGLTFSAGFTLQRTILAALGFLGLAAVFTVYDLEGPVYVLVGVVMFVAGWFLLRGSDIHLPLDDAMERVFGRFLGDHHHHTTLAERAPIPEAGLRPIPTRMAAVHGFVAGWGFGAYATIIVFILAPQMPNVGWAALVGTAFGLGTMIMQMITGALFARLARLRRLSTDQVKRVGRSTAARTLYVGGLAFAAIGALLVAFPYLGSLAVATGSSIPNLDSIGVAFVLVVVVVGVIGGYNLARAYREVARPAPNTVTEPPPPGEGAPPAKGATEPPGTARTDDSGPT